MEVETVLRLAGLLSMLAALICNIVILIHAFKDSILQGFLFLCVPCYALYYMVARFEHRLKWLIIVVAIGGYWVGKALLFVGGDVILGTESPPVSAPAPSL